MDIDELRTVQTKERQKDSLQHLRDSFYEDVAAYVEGLKERRQAAADAADDPFADPEVSRLTDEIETAEEVVEAVYERRVGKVVKSASFAAAEMSVDEDGLTAQEQDLFDDLVGRINENKGRVLDILAGEGDSGAAPTPTAAGPVGGSPAAAPGGTEDTARGPDAVGGEANPVGGEAGSANDEPNTVAGGPETTSPETDTPDHSEPALGTGGADSPEPPDSAPEAPPAAPPEPPEELPDDGPASGQPKPEGNAPVAGDEPAADEGLRGRPDGGVETVPNDPRTTVRITADVGPVLGMDDREYDLEAEDVVALPEENADALLEREAAEEL